MNNKKGFTLIELLTVIIILAVIALIAVPIVLGVIEKAEKGAFKSSVLLGYDAVRYKLMDNDIPPEGISIEELKQEKRLKGGLIGGKYKKDKASNKIIAEYITDGKYCAYGYLSNLTISKDCILASTNVYYNNSTYTNGQDKTIQEVLEEIYERSNL